jgi:hypothetical protein
MRLLAWRACVGYVGSVQSRIRSFAQNVPWVAPAAYALALETRALGYLAGRGIVLFLLSGALVLTAARATPGVAQYARYGALLAAALVRPASIFGELLAQVALALAVYAWVNQLDDMRGLGGIARSQQSLPKFAPRLVLVGIVVAPWLGHSAIAQFFAASAIVGSLCALLFRTRALHRLELGVTPRPELGMGLLAAAFVVACAVAPAMSFLWVFRLAIFAVSPLIFALVTTSSYELTVRVIRRVLAVAALAAVVALGTSLLVGAYPLRAAAAAFAVALIGVAVGALSSEVERALMPEGGRLIDSVRRAHDALLSSEPAGAMGKVLDLLCAGGRSATLFTVAPPLMEVVDLAGYLEQRALAIPPDVVGLALAEPLCTLRQEVLREHEVRRPEVRAALSWLETNRFRSLTLAVSDGVVIGALALPSGERVRALVLEEVLAVKALTDGLVLVLEARSATARLLADRLERDEALERAEGTIEQRDHALSLEAGRHQAATYRLARPTAVGLYSPAQRLAYEAIERRVAHGATVVVATDGTLDPIAYLARAHLSGARKRGALVVVDATLSREHAVFRWKDPDASPFALASGGLLVLSDAFCLPLDVQELIARVHLERRPPWERAEALDLQVALTYCGDLGEWRARGAIHALFDSRFQLEGGAHTRLPSLSERAEDLRAVLSDALAREGMRLFGEPLGIETAAVGRFFDHPFEGGDVELAFIVQVLARTVKGRAVTRDDVERVLHQQRWLVANDGTGATARASWGPKT